MFISRLIINPRSRQVQSEIARPYQMHKTIMKAFPDGLPTDERVLFRLEEQTQSGWLMLLVQSQHEPDWSRLTFDSGYLIHEGQLPDNIDQNPSTKLVELHLYHGQQLAFRLYANPTKKIKSDQSNNGKRIGLINEEEQIVWLQRKLEGAGAQLQAAQTSAKQKINALQNRNGEHNNIIMLGVRFEGVILVRDPENLIKAVNQGIGSGKGFGFGLLSLAPYRG